MNINFLREFKYADDDGETPVFVRKGQYYLTAGAVYIAIGLLLAFEYPLFAFVKRLRSGNYKLKTFLGEKKEDWLGNSNGDMATESRLASENLESSSESGSEVPVEEITGEGEFDQEDNPYEDEGQSTPSPRSEKFVLIEDESSEEEVTDDDPDEEEVVLTGSQKI